MHLHISTPSPFSQSLVRQQKRSKENFNWAVPGISLHLPTVPPTSAFPVSLGDLLLHLFTGSIPSCLLRDIASVSVSFSSVINFPSLLDQYKVYKHTRMSWSSKCPYFTTPSLVDHSLLANNPFLCSLWQDSASLILPWSSSALLLIPTSPKPSLIKTVNGYYTDDAMVIH